MITECPQINETGIDIIINDGLYHAVVEVPVGKTQFQLCISEDGYDNEWLALQAGLTMKELPNNG